MIPFSLQSVVMDQFSDFDVETVQVLSEANMLTTEKLGLLLIFGVVTFGTLPHGISFFFKYLFQERSFQLIRIH